MPLAFSSLDWGIVVVYMLVATIPGFLCRKYISGQAEFLVAGRTLSVFLATATLTATELGLVTVMYWAELGYDKGFSAMTIGVIALVATLFVGLTGFMVSGLRASNVTTVAEYYEQRYSRGVRLLGGGVIAAAGILNYGVFLQVEAKFVQIITRVPDLELSGGSIVIPGVNIVMMVLLLIVLSYTLMGGMVSVVVTDYIQFIVLTFGIGVTTYWVLTHPDIGGLSGMIAVVREHRPEYGLNPFSTSKNAAGAVAGLGVLWILWQTMHWLGTNTWQTGALRTAATDSPRTARLMWTFTAFNYFGRGTIPMLWGIAALAFLVHTQPADVSTIQPREAMPILLSHLPVGLVGLLMAGMLAALMSTHSSYLLTWSGVLTEDLVSPLASICGRELSPQTRMWITRGFILCLGAFLLIWGLWFEVKETIWGYLSVTGTMYVAGSMTLLAMGLYWKRSSNTGAYLAIIGGGAPGLVYIFLRVMVLLAKSHQWPIGNWLYRANDWMTDPRTGVISFVLAFLGMIVGSIVWPSDRTRAGAALASGSRGHA